ncbi:PREDICTED: probable receptor protein kinase TMK1-like [Fragaria vesca subsp. vesca]
MSAMVLVVVLIGATIGLVLVLGLAFFLYKRKLEASNTESNAHGDINVPDTNRTRILVDVVRHATNNFRQDNLIGTGGFSSVFRAEIDRKIVAVKTIGRMRSGRAVDEAIRSFEREVDVLTKLRHANLVGLVGYCWDAETMILVYEYMAQDLKPSNILLTDSLQAKVADFGLIRPLSGYNATSDTQPAGTAGYKAPEYALYKQISVKADVFSFGVILLELITGKKAVDQSLTESHPHLPNWFCNKVINKGGGGIVWDELEKVIDPTMAVYTDPNTVDSFLEIAKLAISCCNKDPDLRPEMTHVVNIIGQLVKPWKPSEPLPENLEQAADGMDWINIPLPDMVKRWERGEPSGQASSSE